MRIHRILGTLLLIYAAPVHASYQDGAWGIFVLLFSLPAAAIGAILTAVLFFYKQFEKGSVTSSYSVFWGIAPLVALGVTSSANDSTAIAVVLIGWLIFLAIILGPAYFQYSRSQRKESE